MNALYLGLARHVLTGVGMFLAGKGYIAEGDVTAVVGALITLASVGWFAGEKIARRK
jgi:hypothetical protein